MPLSRQTVHAPEIAAAKAMRKARLAHLWEHTCINYANRYWPTFYLVHRAGYIRYSRVGEDAYLEVESAIRKLLFEGRPDLLLPAPIDMLRGRSGSGSCSLEMNLGNPAVPVELHGQWPREADHLVSESHGVVPSTLKVRHEAAEGLVMGGGGQLEIHDHGVETRVDVSWPKMYSLVTRDPQVSAELVLRTFSAGLELYALTFGSCS